MIANDWQDGEYPEASAALSSLGFWTGSNLGPIFKNLHVIQPTGFSIS
jgi:hypothetical protein